MSDPRRRFRKPTPERLANAALYYLSRYAASEASLRRVLENKLRRAAMQDEVFGQDHEAQAVLRQAIDKIIETYRTSGVLNDAAYAEMKVHSLRRAGRSSRIITQKLSQKGVKEEHITRALDADGEGDVREDDLQAAISFAKKKRLGCYRQASLGTQINAQNEAKYRQKDIATLARAGFPFDLIKQVLGGDIEVDGTE